MVDAVRTLFNRLSPTVSRDLLDRVGIDSSDLGELRNFERTREILERLTKAPNTARIEVEAIAGRVVAFAAKSDIAERALWACSQDDSGLADLLNQSASLEERALSLWFLDRRTFERANNVASGYHWAGGKYHCAFRVAAPGTLVTSLQDVAAEIGALIQSQAGGRKVDPDLFSYPDPEHAGETAEERPVIHHLAIYVEAPASYWVGFSDDEDKATPQLRRDAKEVSISYNPAKQTLDVAGRGIGGSKVLEEIAHIFEAYAIQDVPFEKLKRVDWNLDRFLGVDTPVLEIPDGFSSLVVRSVSCRNRSQKSAQAIFRGEGSQDAYDRMKQLGVNPGALAFEWVRSVMFELQSTETADVPARPVRMTLNWPNGAAFDGATMQEQAVLNAWAQEQQQRQLYCAGTSRLANWEGTRDHNFARPALQGSGRGQSVSGACRKEP